MTQIMTCEQETGSCRFNGGSGIGIVCNIPVTSLQG